MDTILGEYLQFLGECSNLVTAVAFINSPTHRHSDSNLFETDVHSSGSNMTLLYTIIQGKYRVLCGVTQACKQLVPIHAGTPHTACQNSIKHTD